MPAPFYNYGTKLYLCFWGQSFISNTYGKLIAKGSISKEEIIIAEINLKEINKSELHKLNVEVVSDLQKQRSSKNSIF